VLAIPGSLAIPGAAPRLPWPKDGQAGLYIKNIGDFGRVSQATNGAIPADTATTTGGGNANIAAPAPIASVAKIMTAYLTLRARPLQPGQQGPTITVTKAEADAYPHEDVQGQSVVPVRAGETLTERQALLALMLPSANNMARILARWVAGSVPAFLTRMNAAAATLCMTSTRYTDPSGFDAGTVSTADDQIRLAEIVLTIPAFADIVATRTAAIPLAGPVRNVNRLLGAYGIDGVKTGSMNAAGGNLVFTATAPINGHSVRIIGAVLNQDKGLPEAFTQSQALVLAARRAIRPYTLIKTGQVIAVTSDQTPIRAAADVSVLGWPGLRYDAALQISLGVRVLPGDVVGVLELHGLGPPATVKLVAG
jgi:D-alanyl-D-alanine carboxypeptidase (penicillin-binding protein 5/6)